MYIYIHISISIYIYIYISIYNRYVCVHTYINVNDLCMYRLTKPRAGPSGEHGEDGVVALEKDRGYVREFGYVVSVREGRDCVSYVSL